MVGWWDGGKFGWWRCYTESAGLVRCLLLVLVLVLALEAGAAAGAGMAAGVRRWLGVASWVAGWGCLQALHLVVHVLREDGDFASHD